MQFYTDATVGGYTTLGFTLNMLSTYFFSNCPLVRFLITVSVIIRDNYFIYFIPISSLLVSYDILDHLCGMSAHTFIKASLSINDCLRVY